VLEPDDGKLSRPVLRGPAPSDGGWLLGKGVKRIICGTRFGALVYFAFSGMNSAVSALCARPKSPVPLDGAFITASPG